MSWKGQGGCRESGKRPEIGMDNHSLRSRICIYIVRSFEMGPVSTILPWKHWLRKLPIDLHVLPSNLMSSWSNTTLSI